MYKNSPEAVQKMVLGFEDTGANPVLSHKLGKHPPLGFTHSTVLTFLLELQQITLGEKWHFWKVLPFLLLSTKMSVLSFTKLIVMNNPFKKSCSVQRNEVRALCVTGEIVLAQVQPVLWMRP